MKVAVKKSGGRTLFKNQNHGATLIEMALAVGLIAMIAMPAIKYLGNELQDMFSSIDAGFEGIGVGESSGGSGNEQSECTCSGYIALIHNGNCGYSSDLRDQWLHFWGIENTPSFCDNCTVARVVNPECPVHHDLSNGFTGARDGVKFDEISIAEYRESLQLPPPTER